MRSIHYYIILSFLAICACGKNYKPQLQNDTYVASSNIENNELTIKKEQTQEKEYPIKYELIQPRSISNSKGNDSIEVENIISIYNIQLITGLLKERPKEGIHLFVINDNDNVMYTSKGQQDSWRLQLSVYKANNTNHFIVLGEIGAEESWGTYLYWYNGKTFTEIDFLDYVALNSYEEYESIIPFIILEEEKKKLLVKFKEDIFLFDNKSKQKVKGNQVILSYNK
ncbi:hypothetical protein [uncultured Aquimarina sp.]|uniref:hypothetical protein n=1 Tax=uncultured Aquimarina sp. TaxID=575652 RepID=UPI00260E3254|nr:hypothetical protein [uncultured Aquimarina sp.]